MTSMLSTGNTIRSRGRTITESDLVQFAALTGDWHPQHADAEFAAVQGGVHAFFGDYGAQPGDGDPGISREAAQEQITAATVDFLGQL